MSSSEVKVKSIRIKSFYAMKVTSSKKNIISITILSHILTYGETAQWHFSGY